MKKNEHYYSRSCVSVGHHRRLRLFCLVEKAREVLDMKIEVQQNVRGEWFHHLKSSKRANPAIVGSVQQQEQVHENRPCNLHRDWFGLFRERM